MTRSRLALAGLLLAWHAVANASYQTAPEGPLRVTSITPSGTEVPPGRQIVIQFDRKVVPLGRMERRSDEIPVRIEPELACEWRWLQASTLACQLSEAEALRPATRYRVAVAKGIVTENGAGLEAPVEHVFETETPSVTSSSFEEWLGPGSPQLTVAFNQRMSQRELEARLRFESETGSLFPVEVTPLDEADTEPERFWRIRATSERHYISRHSARGASRSGGPVGVANR